MINRFRQMCQTMPYRDMVDLSTMLSEALKDRVSPEEVAHAMTNLPGDTEDDQQENTNQILQSCFNRKKTLTIQPEAHSAGGSMYKIACPSIDGAVVFESNIREGVSQLLDTITVLQAFRDG